MEVYLSGTAAYLLLDLSDLYVVVSDWSPLVIHGSLVAAWARRMGVAAFQFKIY